MQLDAILSLLLKGSDNDLRKTLSAFCELERGPHKESGSIPFYLLFQRTEPLTPIGTSVLFTSPSFPPKFSVSSQRFGILSNLSAPVCSRSVCLWRTLLAYFVCVCKSIHLPHYRTVSKTFSLLLPVTLCVLRVRGSSWASHLQIYDVMNVAQSIGVAISSSFFWLWRSRSSEYTMK